MAVPIARLWNRQFVNRWLCPICQHKLVLQTRAITGLSLSTTTPSNRKPLPLEPEKLDPEDKPPILKPITKPVGQIEIPRPGDNSHYDTRTWSERFLGYFERREAMRQWMKPAFQPLHALRLHKGKTFLATPSLYKAEKALYLPNFQGYTLADPKKIYDTTNVLTGKVSIVKLHSEVWGGMQCDSYTTAEMHPEIAEVLDQYKEMGLQIVNINVTENRMRAFFVRRSINWQKKQVDEEDWPRYFMVRRGITDYTRADIHMRNPKVGHVFLVDWQCKIRWTGCGDASDEEKEGLVACVRHLMEAPRSKKPGTERSKTNSAQQLKQPLC